jgi:adenine specific DNA methylase Mod
VQERQRSLDLFSSDGAGDWRNRLIWGDKKYVLPTLRDEFAGKVDFIYIDPPFATGADFSYTATIPEAPDDDDDGRPTTFVKQPSILEQKAYRDTWGNGLQSYLQWFWETAMGLQELMAPTATLYVHLDWRMVHYARVVLDEVLGPDRFENEIIWQRSLPHGNVDYKFGASHDTLLRYSKTSDFTWKPQYVPHREQYLKDFYKYEENGRRYRLISCINPNPNRPNLTYAWKGVTRVWKYTKERMARMDKEGLLVYSKNGVPSYKGFLDQMKGVPMQDVWTDIPPLMGGSHEWVDYPTQKPEALLERLLQASTNEGDLVLDCFSGSGTTAAVAERLGRRWIACDMGRFAVHTARKRLLAIPQVKPFVVQNLGKYERQVWQTAEFGKTAAARTAAYRRFILELYQARPVNGHAWLHGLKQGRMVHVGTVDAPVTVGDIKQIAVEFRKVVGTGKDAPSSTSVDVLGWDFAFELNEVARQEAGRAGIDMRFVRIPREVLDKRAVVQGDVRFFELAALSVDLKRAKRSVTLRLTDFVIPLDDVPEDIQRAISDWSQWIDYWAVDWNNHGDTFHNEWQCYRSRKDSRLDLTSTHEYDEPGEYTVVVKVIDILGNDTTKTVSVTVPGRA